METIKEEGKICSAMKAMRFIKEVNEGCTENDVRHINDMKKLIRKRYVKFVDLENVEEYTVYFITALMKISYSVLF